MASFNIGDGRRLNVSIGQPPTDVTETDSDSLEKELDEVLYSSDNWVYEYEPAGHAKWDRVSRMSNARKEAHGMSGRALSGGS